MTSLGHRTECRRLLVIHNPRARRNRADLEPALALLTRRGIEVVLQRTNAAGQAEAWAAAAPASEFAAVVAAGGDGTINDVANGLMQRPDSMPLGILPMGTANVLARELGLPRSLAPAAEVLLAGATRPIWPGLANGRYFLMMAGAGRDARIVARMPRWLKLLVGRSAYIVEGARQLAGPRPLRCRAVIDGVPVEAGSVVIAKGHHYGGRFVLAPAAHVGAPHFQVCLFLSNGHLAAIRYWAAMALGRLHRLRDYRVVAGRQVLIEGRAGDPVQGDGDIITALPVMTTLAARPLQVLAPPGGRSLAGDGHAIDP